MAENEEKNILQGEGASEGEKKPEVDLYFHIFSAETWNEIVDTQPIKLTF